jgi:hypothetical protein
MAEAQTAPPPGQNKWNYRVMAREGVLGIHEVFYNPDGSILWFSADPVPCSGESLDELAADVQRQANALNQGVLDFHLLEQKAKYRRDGVYEDAVTPQVEAKE